MKFRFLGLVPALALLAAGAAQAQSTSGGGQMAYPDPRPSGEIRVPAPSRTPDTGSMALPAPSGGVTVAAPRGNDTGNMALPTGRSGITTSTAPAVLTPAPAVVPAATPAATPVRRRRVRRPRPVRVSRPAPTGSVDVPSTSTK